MFINDIFDQLPPGVMKLLFADDVTIAKGIIDPEDLLVFEQAIHSRTYTEAHRAKWSG